MPRQIIATPNASSSPLYSQGIKAGSQVLVSGTTGIDPATGTLAGDTIQDQTRQALANCEAILHAGGASLEDVIEVGVLLADPADFADMNEEYARWFPTDPPVRYAARLGAEIPGLLVSIRMTACTPLTKRVRLRSGPLEVVHRKIARIVVRGSATGMRDQRHDRTLR